MGFLFPLYMLGAAMVALPIYLHLRRKPPKDTVEFSSLMFLEPTKHQPIKRRSQLENWPLLLLRCLALLALAGMFSRPFFAGGEADGSEGALRTVVVLDTSASVRREGVWQKATDAAEEAVAQVSAGGALALVAADQNPRTVIGFSEWLDEPAARRAEAARDAIATLEPSWASTDLGTSLLAAAEMIADAAADDQAPLAAEIVVISDLQSGADLDAIAGAAWPENVSIKLVSLEPDHTTNAALSVAPTTDDSKFAVRVRNDPASERSEFKLTAGGASQSAVVPAGESRVFEFDAGADRVTLTGDDHDFDNTLFIAPRQPAPVDLLFMGKGDADDSNAPEYYFRRAFGFSQVLRPRFVESLADAPSIIAVARPLDDTETGDLRRSLESGGHAMLVLTGTDMARTLAGLTGMASPPDLTERDGDYALLEGIDFDHPSLREFRDPRWRDFTNVHFWHSRSVDAAALPEDTQIVANFDDGAPAWFELPVGEGSLFVMAAGWHPRDSQLALSSKFLPLLFSVFADVGPRVGAPAQFFVGEPLPLEEGESLAASAPTTPSKPGVYETTGTAITRHFAVNLRPSESELAPLPNDTFAALGIPVAGSSAAAATLSPNSQRKLRESESEAQQNLWRAVVLILLGLLAAESWIAGRPQKAEPQTTAAVPS